MSRDWATRYDLHRIFVRPVAPDIGNIAATVHQHRVPCKQGLIVKRCGMVAITIGHELGGLCRACAALVGGTMRYVVRTMLHTPQIWDCALDLDTRREGDFWGGEADALD